MTAILRALHAPLSAACLSLLLTGCATNGTSHSRAPSAATSNLTQELAQNANADAGVVLIRNVATSNREIELPQTPAAEEQARLGLTFSPFVQKKPASSEFVQDPFLQQFLPDAEETPAPSAPNPPALIQPQPATAPAKLFRADVLRTALQQDQQEVLRPVRSREAALQVARGKLRMAENFLITGDLDRATASANEAQRILEESAIALSPDEISPTALINQIRQRILEQSQDKDAPRALEPPGDSEALLFDQDAASWTRVSSPEVEVLLPPEHPLIRSAMEHSDSAAVVANPSASTARSPSLVQTTTTDQPAIKTQSAQTKGTSIANHRQAAFTTNADSRPTLTETSALTSSAGALTSSAEISGPSVVNPQPSTVVVQNTMHSDARTSMVNTQVDTQQESFSLATRVLSSEASPAATETEPMSLPSVRFDPPQPEARRPAVNAQMGIGLLGLLLLSGGMARLLFRRTAI